MFWRKIKYGRKNSKWLGSRGFYIGGWGDFFGYVKYEYRFLGSEGGSYVNRLDKSFSDRRNSKSRYFEIGV